MDIFDLPIVALCDQYLTYLSAMEALDLNVAGEFLVMAATLLEIKSRLLLPAPPKDDTDDPEGDHSGVPLDPRAELVQRLLEYGKYQAIAEELRRAEDERRMLFFRAPTEYSGKFAAPPRWGEMSADSLLRTLERMLQAVGGEAERSVTSVRRQKITLRMKMREVAGLAERSSDGVLLIDLLPTHEGFALLEIVLVFLALLELMKSGMIIAAQHEFCGDIRIFFVSEPERAALLAGDLTMEDA